MNYVDKLKQMPPPPKQKTPEERKFDLMIQTAHISIQRFCEANRENRAVQGYLIYCKGDSEYGSNEGVHCYHRMYRYDYPYKKDIGYQRYPFKRTTRRGLDLGDDISDECTSGERTVISKDPSFCERVKGKLYALLRNDGFPKTDLETVPVYASEIREYEQGFFSPTYYEERRLTNQLEGYIIRFSLAW